MIARPITLLHNPRCSKSREALSMLRQRGIDVDVREYLDKPLDSDELASLVDALGDDFPALIRNADARASGLTEAPVDMSPESICIWLAANPETMQRPVLIAGARAAIGRPPSSLLALIE